MMMLMNLVERCAGISRTILCTVIPALFLTGSVISKQWDSDGAAIAFQEARQKRSEISSSSQPGLSLYLECAKTYRKVHVKDPHYVHTGEAIYEEGLIYQEMGERFSNLDFFRTATKRLQLLVTQYAGNANCPDALLRLGNIFEHNLKDETAAQDAYQKLRTQFRHSAAARQVDAKETIQKVPQPSTAIVEKRSQDDAAVSLVKSVRHLSTDESYRVIIDLDSDAKYIKEKLRNPDRVYLDIAKAKLCPDLKAQAIPVGDEFLQQIRIAIKSPDTIRVVLDLAAASDYAVSELRNPFRIVVDFFRPAKSGAVVKPPAMETKPQPSSAAPNPAAKNDSTKENPSPKTASMPIPPPGASIPITVVEAKPKETPRAVTEIQPVPLSSLDKVRATTEVKNTPKASESPIAPIEKKEDRSVAVAEATVKLPPQTVAKTQSGNHSSAAAQSPSLPSAGKPVAVSKTDTAPLPSFPKPASPTSLGNRTLTRALGLKIGRIAIDPGHGGHDWGTIGPGGLYEKDLVLSIARDLQDLLVHQMGAEVFLTRNDDRFITLDERTAIANQFRADLFISIHANSSRIQSIAGVETYYLDFAKTEAEREIAARENATTASPMHELEDLIKKIAQADKSAESRELALFVQKNLFAGSKKMIPTTQNRGVRSAPFIVLIGANMPSILAEVAFISNPKVEKLLKKEANQEHLVKALYSGIEDYMKTLGGELVQNQIPNK
jgi:N-acetylmuramoyl-L-alanine amidase